MKRTAFASLLVLLLASVLLSLGGIVTALRELNVFAVGSPTPEGRFEALLAGDYDPGPSPLSQRLLLDTCNEAISGIYGRLQVGERRRLVLERCREAADAIVADAPSTSFAWYIGALAASALGDAEGFNARVLRSQITGPTEQWIAERRANLVEDNYAAADAEVLARHQRELRLLVASQRGISSIARRYVNDPGFRERVTQIVETMSEADQRRFVSSVRRAAEVTA
jgi:hypothetical protein